tara:strand:+ start:818 stop:1696 length:879 start_codon:yes stop_codon:yes gene_type:complete
VISSDKIKSLRQKTGAGMMDCKKALQEVEGDLESAIDWLRKKGINTAAKKSLRDASDGLITIHNNESNIVILEVNSETDFVARNSDFQDFCLNLSKTILSNKIDNLESLLNINFFETEKMVSEKLTDLISKIGENLKIKRFDVFSKSANEYLSSYLHNSVNTFSGKIGVILKVKSTKEFSDIEVFLKNIAMHIAALDPKSISTEDLDEAIINREKSIYREQLSKSGKPRDIQDKILDGKINKFFEEVCLVKQSFVMENKKSIQEYINDQKTKYDCDIVIQSFKFYRVGDSVQ